ncbi:MAG: DNA alkylation repair protein [Patescibacteria group bacterium]|nr:DNA alkylation repair protein [Patescibacteria group bacterium]
MESKKNKLKSADILGELYYYADQKKAAILQRFFKTGRGEYGFGDIFLGVNVPTQRKIAKKYTTIELKEVVKLLKSKIHESRLVGLIILTDKFSKATAATDRQEIKDFYSHNIARVNSWDLVDLSAPKILGKYLLGKQKLELAGMAKSPSVWVRRIAIVSTFEFIKHKKYSETIKLCNIMINDQHDLIHKACGWVLREVGKRDLNVLLKFLAKNKLKMPRTMLRYAIEKLPEHRRQAYLN